MLARLLATTRSAHAAAPAACARALASAPPPPEKVECFIDGKKVLVDPGTTVLQVRRASNLCGTRWQSSC